jgi:hypothetical protein
MAKRTSLSCYAMILRPGIFDFVRNLGFIGALGGLGG